MFVEPVLSETCLQSGSQRGTRQKRIDRFFGASFAPCWFFLFVSELTSYELNVWIQNVMEKAIGVVRRVESQKKKHNCALIVAEF